MSLFSKSAKVESGKTDRPLVPEGKYVGKIVSPTIKQSKAGHSYISYIIKTDGGQLFQSLHLQHPNAQESAKKELGKILNYGVANLPDKIDSLQEAASAIDLVPVHVTVKHGEYSDGGYMNYKVYFNELPKGVEKRESVDAGSNELPF